MHPSYNNLHFGATLRRENNNINYGFVNGPGFFATADSDEYGIWTVTTPEAIGATRPCEKVSSSAVSVRFQLAKLAALGCVPLFINA